MLLSFSHIVIAVMLMFICNMSKNQLGYAFQPTIKHSVHHFKIPYYRNYAIFYADEDSTENIVGIPMDKRSYRVGDKPDSGFLLAKENFFKELTEILKSVKLFSSRESEEMLLPESLGLTLSNEAVKEAEMVRERLNGRVGASPVARFLYDLGCLFLDSFFDGRPIARFWFLEVVARIPYFSYVSMLHLYESFGWWRQPSLRKVHNAEEWNELHHLLIMEALGGDKIWFDRFLGYHAAALYYWLLIGTYLFSPRVAYQFMELLESHAIDTYGEFLNENAEKLKTIASPDIAVSYYTGGDLYQFDDFQIDRPPGSRRPPCDTLYDVFTNIRDDEAEHVSTMRACQNYATLGKMVISPHLRFNSTASNETKQGRKDWNRWAIEVNHQESSEKSNKP